MGIQLSIDGPLSCFQFLVIVNKTSMYSRVQVLVWIYVISLISVIRGSRLVGFYAGYMF